MPELPEVETIVRSLRPVLVGCAILDVHCTWPRTLRPRLDKARRWLIGRRIADVSRRGKFIVVRLAGGANAADVALLVHLRMSGRLALAARDSPPDKHLRFRLALDRGRELRFVDARKFGRVIVTPKPQDVLQGLGVEPLEAGFTPRVLGELVKGRSRILKPLLLDQTIIAGIGNIYSDEALHRARLHPLRNSRSLTIPEVRRLHLGIQAALQAGIAANGASIDWVYPGGNMQDQFRAYGRTGQPCPTCGTAIRRITVGQRGTHFCPRCQGRSGRLDTDGGHRSLRSSGPNAVRIGPTQGKHLVE